MKGCCLDALRSAQVMRRALLDQATTESACFGDARSAEVSSAQISSGGQKFGQNSSLFRKKFTLLTMLLVGGLLRRT
jgi:hypothetical protein